MQSCRATDASCIFHRRAAEGRTFTSPSSCHDGRMTSARGALAASSPTCARAKPILARIGWLRVAPRLHESTGMLTRKQFLHRALGACAGALGLTLLHACGDDSVPSGGGTGSGGNIGGGNEVPVDAPPSPIARCVQNGTMVTIRTNHGHVMVVSKEDVAARQQKSYDIHGSADHTHTVTITADMMAQLNANSAI